MRRQHSTVSKEILETESAQASFTTPDTVVAYRLQPSMKTLLNCTVEAGNRPTSSALCVCVFVWLNPSVAVRAGSSLVFNCIQLFSFNTL